MTSVIELEQLSVMFGKRPILRSLNAYALGDRITIAANTEGGAFGLSPASLIGMPNSFEMQHILMNAMGGVKTYRRKVSKHSTI